jgi:hypothetical protein
MGNSGRARLRLLIAEVALTLLLVAAVEGGFRYYLAQHQATLLPAIFPSPLTTGKYLAYRQLPAQPVPLEILLMGMSQMMRVSAGQLSEQLAERYRRPVRAFNFAAPSHTVEYDRRILQDVLLPLKPPRVLIYGVIPTNVFMETFVGMTP